MSLRTLALILCTVWLVFRPTPSVAQKLASEARGSALSQIVMVSLDSGGCAAGIIVGFDERTIYVATADHVVTDPSTGAPANLSAKFLGVSDPRPAVAFGTSEPRGSGDLAVIMVARDAILDKYLGGLNFSILPTSSSPAFNVSVNSIGCWGGSLWASGSDEVLLAATQANLRVHSTVNEGQSGGGLFSAAWELIGMPLDVGANEIAVRPIDSILRDLRTWGIPVALKPRPSKDRVMGADELAQLVLRRERSATLAAQSNALRAGNPMRALILGAEAVKQTSKDGFVLAPAREALTNAQLGTGGVGFAGGDTSYDPAAIDSSEKLLATASETGAIRIWRLAGAAPPECIKVLQNPDRSRFTGLAFDKASTRIIALTRDPNTSSGSVWSWPLDTPDREPQPLVTPLSGGDRAVTAITVSYSGDTLAVADAHGELSLYGFASGPLKPAFRTLQIPPGHRLSHISFSRDGTVLLAGTGEAWAFIWNLASTAPLPVAAFDTGHRRPAFGPDATPDLDLLDLSDDHSMLLTGSSVWSPDSSVADPTLRIWRLQHLVPSGDALVIDQVGASDPNKALENAFFLPNQHAAVVITLSGKINTWDVSKTLTNSPNSVPTPTFQAKLAHNADSSSLSADRRFLVIGNGKNVSLVRVPDLQRATSSEFLTFHGFDIEAGLVRVSRSGRYLFASGIGRDGRLWDLDKVDPLAPSASVVRNPYAEVQALRMSNSGKLVAVARGASFELWDIADPTNPVLRYSLEIDPDILKNDYEGSCPSCHVLISPDDKWLIVQGSKDKQSLAVEIQPSHRERRQFSIPTPILTSSITFSPDGRLLLIDGEDDTTIAYDLHAPKYSPIVVSESVFYSSPAFSPDGRWICFYRDADSAPAGSDSGFIAPVDALTDASKRIKLTGFAGGVGAVVFSPDSQWIAIAGAAKGLAHDHDDRSVQLFRAEGGTWHKNAELQPLEYSALRLEFSKDGRWLFTGSADVTLGDRNVSSRIWDLRKPLTPDAGQKLDGLIWNDKLAAFSPDSQWLVTVSGAESYGRLWSLKDGKVQMTTKLTGPKPNINNHWGVAFSPDAKGLVLWTFDDNTPFFWNLEDARPAELGIALPNGDRSIEDVRFSPTGRALTILNSDLIGTQGGETAHVTFIDLNAFPEEDAYAVLPASSGAHSYNYREDLGLVVSSGDKIVVVPADLKVQLDRAKLIAGRNLTWEEWVKSPLRGDYHPTFTSLPVGSDVLEALAPNVEALIANGRTTEAIQLEHDLVGWALSLDDANVCNDVAWDLAAAKDIADATTLSNCALRQVPNNANYRDTHGLVLALSGQQDAAIAEFNYFIEHVQGIERFAHDIPVRQMWIQALRSGKNPFAETPP
ncbi:trypsin-like peptidase domain-containing protein [Caballeronia sp. SBC2]|uniref:trypsin-like peptidase domain-containing protein n=1 Tax=Caballeronia sp. SBC2 TaxID=2705547 RepID=UPI0013E0FC25|nr:trypsin-like peptidase domain-containing protein [Caballeronia sp. SBC2]QIE30230.1 WD domain, G-beta repeat [Caballeronia sp. SBC2]